jgi:type II secretory pathway component PulK
MKLLPIAQRAARAESRRGAALLLSLLILLILVAIVIQINVSTGTDARIGRNDVTISTMDLAAESALLQCAESLKSDSDADSAALTEGAPGGAAGAGGTGLPTGGTVPPGAGGAPQQQSAPVDSRRDEWASPQRTEINQIQLRIITQDENSKYNVLNMLVSDEKEAEAAYNRVVRILDACREGTQYDIDPRTAEEMASVMREHMTKRPRSKLPRPKLLTDDEKNEDLGLPTSLREFLPLQPFEELHFRDFRDQDNLVVHSITTFLTVWSSLSTNPNPPPVTASSNSSTKGTAGSNSSNSSNKSGTGSTSSNKSGTSSGTSGSSTSGGKGGSSTSQTTGSGNDPNAQQPGGTAAGANDPNASGAQSGGGGGSQVVKASTSGGFSVNVNTAPVAVLKSLFDSREVPGRFWDKVVEYRNLEDQEEKEKAKDAETAGAEEEEQLDEYGEPVIVRQIFKSVQDLSKVDGWGDLSAETQAKVTQILTVQSEVFSVFVIARKVTAVEDGAGLGLTPAETRKREETRGDALQRVVHAVLWRQKTTEETKIVPVVRWEILDYMPYEVLDFPPEDR